MKMVIGQLEGILKELKEVAKELREVSERRGWGGMGGTQTSALPGWAQPQNMYVCLSVQCYVHMAYSTEAHPFHSSFFKSVLLKITVPRAGGAFVWW